MKKIIINKPGSYDKLEVQEFADLTCEADNVLVDVQYCGINYADVLVRWGVYKSAKEFVGWPITPGFEISGIVKSVGKKVKGFKPGDRVIGVTLFNGYSTQISLPERQVFKAPDNLSLAECATTPTVFITAYHALYQNFVVRPGMKFLIHSAAGGVGSALVQLSHILNCEVTAVIGSNSKAEYLKKLGVKNIIAKEVSEWTDKAKAFSPMGYDAIFDANGASTLKQSYDLLAPTGKLVVYGFHSMLPKDSGRLNYFKLIKTYLQTPRFNPLDMTSANKSLITFNLSFLFDKAELLIEAMNNTLKYFENKKLRPLPVTEYAFEDVAKAHQAIETGNTIGKLALKV